MTAEQMMDQRMADRTGVPVEQLRREKAEFEAMVAKGVKEKAEPKPKAKKATKAEAKKLLKKVPKGDGRSDRTKKVKSEGTGIKALTKAKERYRANGDVNSCGDWLAKTLKENFQDEEGVFDVAAFTKCCKQNGLDVTEKWATNRSVGWQGRFRMNGRQKLEIVLARQGFITIDGQKVKPTGTFLKAMEKRHENAIIEDEDAEDEE